MIDCSVFQDNVRLDPVFPQVLRRNYGNTPAAPDEVDLDDNANKDANILCVDVNGDPIYNIDSVAFSTKRQQAPYPRSSGESYSVLYDSEFKANYELRVVSGSISGTGTGSGVSENQLGWGTSTNSFVTLDSSDIVYDNNYDYANPIGNSAPLINSDSLPPSLQTYFSKISIDGTPGSWASGTPTLPINNSITYVPGNFAALMKSTMDFFTISTDEHVRLCGIIKDEVRQELRFNITETDVQGSSTQGTVSYQLQLIET